MKPNEALAEWINSLDKDVKLEIGGHVVILLPELWKATKK
jgi:hypothetical protein